MGLRRAGREKLSPLFAPSRKPFVIKYLQAKFIFYAFLQNTLKIVDLFRNS